MESYRTPQERLWSIQDLSANTAGVADFFAQEPEVGPYQFLLTENIKPETLGGVFTYNQAVKAKIEFQKGIVILTKVLEELEARILEKMSKNKIPGKRSTNKLPPYDLKACVSTILIDGQPVPTSAANIIKANEHLFCPDQTTETIIEYILAPAQAPSESDPAVNTVQENALIAELKMGAIYTPQSIGDLNASFNLPDGANFEQITLPMALQAAIAQCQGDRHDRPSIIITDAISPLDPNSKIVVLSRKGHPIELMDTRSLPKTLNATNIALVYRLA